MVRQKLSTLCDALRNELRQYTAFDMATISEYGYVGDYDPDYLSLKEDILAFFDIYSELRPGVDVSVDDYLPPLKRNREMAKSFFDRERKVLLAALDQVAEDASLVDDDVVNAAAARSSDAGSALSALMERADVELEPSSDQNAQGDACIYVSTRRGAELTEAVRDVVAASGLTPLSPRRPLSDRQTDADWIGLKRMIERCDGAIISVIAEDGGRIDPDALKPGGPLAAAALEIAIAEAHFPERVILIARARDVAALPPSLRSKPIFAVGGDRLAADERALLSYRISQPVWQ